MIHDTLSKIEERVQNSQSMSPEGRAELLRLVGNLKAEISGLSEEDLQQAQSIAGFTDLSTHEATRPDRKPQLLKHAVDGLTATVDGFENKHPKLVEAINRLSYMLSNMGI